MTQKKLSLYDIISEQIFSPWEFGSGRVSLATKCMTVVRPGGSFRALNMRYTLIFTTFHHMIMWWLLCWKSFLHNYKNKCLIFPLSVTDNRFDKRVVSFLFKGFAVFVQDDRIYTSPFGLFYFQLLQFCIKPVIYFILILALLGDCSA